MLLVALLSNMALRQPQTLMDFIVTSYCKFLLMSQPIPRSRPLSMGYTWYRLLITFLIVTMLGCGLLTPSAIAQARPVTGFALTPTPAPNQSIAPYFNRVADRLTEFRLDNGMKFLVLERHQAPVVSFLTYADVGGANEPTGETGVAHFLEHLAFKGTQRIGTKNYKAEKPLLNRLDILAEQIKTGGNKVATLQAEFDKVQAEALKLVEQNELGQIVLQAGGVGLNANTSVEATRYFYSFPANKLELWMSLESERFLEPVFREFYKEKDVILEERRLRVDNSPIGTMVEALLDKAFTVHPYKRPTIGYEQDIRNLTRQDVQQFFDTYYVPSNITIALVGDVNPKQVKELAQAYFGRFKAKPSPPKLKAVEPKQTEVREVELKLPSQPWYLEAYHRPAIRTQTM